MKHLHIDYRITSYNVCYTKLLRIITEEERIRIEGMYEQKKGSTPWEPRGDELHLIMAALKNGNIDARAVAGIPGFIIKDNGSKWSAAYNDTYFQAWKRELKK